MYTPYTCTLFDIQADGTAATDIEHIVALAEAYDSGLAESQFRTFAGDIDNLTIADPTVNRRQKSDLDAGEWEPPENRGWFAARVVAVKQKYGLSVNPDERDALQAMLNSAPSRTVTCGGGLVEVVSAQHKYIFPQFAFGGGWESTLMVQALGSNTTCTFSAQDRSFTMRGSLRQQPLRNAAAADLRNERVDDPEDSDAAGHGGFVWYGGSRLR